MSVPTLGFFDDMKKGFEAGLASSSSSSTQPTAQRSKKAAAPSSFFDGLTKAFSTEQPTEEELIEERKRAGEGVLWSAGYGRAWRSKNGMPQDEISVEEAKRISVELSIPIPDEVLGSAATDGSI